MTGRFGVLILLCTMMYGAATAQAAAGASSQPSHEQVMKLMSAMGIPQSIDESLHQAQIRVKDAARESFLKQNPNPGEATLKKLDEIFDSTPFFKFDDIAEAVIPVYQKNLSAGDVQAGIDFYGSEAGKRLLEKVPAIMREANEQGGKLVQSKMDAYGDELERRLDAFQLQLNSTNPPAAPQADTADGTGKTQGEKSK